MALTLADRVKEITSSSGTDPFALQGAPLGFSTFNSAVGVGNTTYYCVIMGGEWECGLGTMSTATTLTRDTVLSSSNNNQMVTFAAGVKEVFVTYPAAKAVYKDNTGSVNIPTLTASRVAVTDDNKNLASSAVTSTELEYLSGTTSVIQEQLDTLSGTIAVTQGMLDTKQPLDDTLTALASLVPNGLLIKTSDNSFAGRTITGTANQINVNNGNGIIGNPTLSLPQDIHTTAIPTFDTVALNAVVGFRVLVTTGTSGAKVVTTSAVTNTELGYLTGVTSSLQGQLDGKQPLDATLTSLAGYNANGFLTQTAPDAFTGRTLTGTINQVNILNADGVAGNPTFSLPQNMDAGASPTFAGINVDGPAVFNETGADADFRVEGDTDPNLFFVDASTGRIGVGTNTPGVGGVLPGRFDVKNDVISQFALRCISATDSDMLFGVLEDASNNGSLYVFPNNTTTASIVLRSSGSSYFNGGSFGIGTSGPQSLLHIAGPSGTDLIVERVTATAAGAPGFQFKKARGTYGTTPYTIVNNGDLLGYVVGMGHDGTNYINSARINFEVDGIPGTNDMPGRIVFLTTPDGSSTLGERLRISQTTQQALLTIGSAALKGLVIKGAASQTANFTEWQDSAGAVLASVTASGGIVTGTPGLILNRTDGAATATITFNTSGRIALAVPLLVNDIYGTNGQQWADNNATLGIIYKSGAVDANGVIAHLWNTNNVFATTKPFEFQEGSVPRLTIGPGGLVGINKATTIGAQLHVVPADSARTAEIIQGTTSQSANLTEWQDSASTIHSTISENGYATTRKNTAPPDAELVAGEAAYWFDSSNTAPKFMVKAKRADGVVVTGSIALT